ncbi:MAG TPA: cyclic pyranopterin monophosphate synthase MoaC [Gemmatimonadaceae bacterium]|nr:cyclic pyranopterin monophosphate synthase MoaC [Gemmatimonadaceae bacterium]
MTDLTHADAGGRARIVDVSAKDETVRVARARGEIRMSSDALNAIRSNTIAKGDVLSVARIAGIMAAKRTAEIIPLCHPIALTDVGIEFDFDDSVPGIIADSYVKTVGRTGVEMEAMTAVACALLTIYDMAKAIDRGMTITAISLIEKTGGKSGDWSR